MFDERLFQFATTREAELLEAWIEYGSTRKAAAAMNCHPSLITQAHAKVKRAALQGQLIANDETPPGYMIKGISTLYGADGEKKAQWVKSTVDAEQREAALRAAAEAMADELPRLPSIKPPLSTLDDLCTVYTLTDAHIGMLAWHREGGEDWDLEIAESTITGCFAEAIRRAPASGTAILNQLGDLLHYDGLSAVTPTSGHILDADGRFTKMVEVAVRVLRRLVTMMLEKHKTLHLVLAEGNHDMASSVWLRTMFKALYEDEPRITVDDSALPYYVFEFGKVMLGFHHSHLKKNPKLTSFMHTQFAPIWGRTHKRYCHTGNLHHLDEKQYDGMIVLQHPTLAARDAYAARGGWFADREMYAITYHRDHGQIDRVIVNPDMVRVAA